VPLLVAGGGRRTTLRLVAEYADACNLGAASCAGVAGVFFLADTDDVARAKLAKLPPWLISGVDGFPALESLVFARTPGQAVAHIRGLVDAGFQYFICRIFESDAETLLALWVVFLRRAEGC
jgi:alkanesulfonate monooxygenase SsuD/methylene tetrahydromethanopterin reductase-like flavin-dependent oxidoreductase (luciferase family)